MHRAGKKPALPPSTSRRNATGYAKRKSLKPHHKPHDSTEDVYEYVPERNRRARLNLQLERDEILGAGPSSGFRDSGSEDEGEGSSRKRLQPRLVGEENDEDGIKDDEDEEIDSDEAFDESDEERFAGFNFLSAKVSTTCVEKVECSS